MIVHKKTIIFAAIQKFCQCFVVHRVYFWLLKEWHIVRHKGMIGFLSWFALCGQKSKLTVVALFLKALLHVWMASTVQEQEVEAPASPTKPSCATGTTAADPLRSTPMRSAAAPMMAALPHSSSAGPRHLWSALMPRSCVTVWTTAETTRTKETVSHQTVLPPHLNAT